jgi:GNAT superfamily N-acetyltransferase
VTETVRPAGADDLPALVHLETAGRAEVAGRDRGGAAWLAERPGLGPDGFRQLLGAPDALVLVGTLDGHVVAVAVARHETAGPLAPRVVVEGVYVEPDARELGFGDELLGAVIGWARERGAPVIESTALPGDRDTKNLFERAGMSARLLVVSRRLSDPSSEAGASR